MLTNKTRKLRLLIAAEVLVVLSVGLIFSFIHPKEFASLFAGGLFICIGCLALSLGAQLQGLPRILLITFSLIHLVGVAIPMMYIRISNYHTAFDELQIWGLPGPLFHSLSNYVYTLLFFATLWAEWRSRRS